MNSKVHERIAHSEAKARQYLQQVCWKNFQPFCLRCGSRNPYRLSSGRYRCKRCRYTFTEFSGRWLSQSRLSCSDWITLVDLFEEERSVEEIARRLGRSYATAFHAVTVLRAGILAHSSTCGALLHDNPETLQQVCSHRGRKTLLMDNHVPVFGIREDGGMASVPILPDVGPDFVLSLPVKKIRRGSLIYTGQVAIYDTLIFAIERESFDMNGTHFARSPVYIDGVAGFWQYASTRLAAHYGVSADHFPLYLKELEFRYNHREEKLAPLLLRYLCDFIPRSHH